MNNIKKLSYNDLNLLKKFITNEYIDFKNFYEIGWNLKSIENHLKKNNNLSFGYFYKNILCGILIGEKIRNNDNYELELHIIFISKKFRRIKFGSRILNYIEKNKSSANISKIFLEVSEKNIEAIRFYEKNKFVFYKIRHNYYNYKNHSISAMCYFKEF